jgi:hypothetical protein
VSTLSAEQPDSPVHLGSKSAVRDFAGDELLYRRYSREHFVNGKLLPAAFRFAETSGPSFNRSAFSKPEDVLHPDCCGGQRLLHYGILQCAVSDLPSPLIAEAEGTPYFFSPRHKPEPTCYAHTEVWCRRARAEIKEGPLQPPKAIRERFRIELAKVLTINRIASDSL